MEIIRNDDGSLLVPIPEGRHHDSDDATDATAGDGAEGTEAPTTRLLHPGELLQRGPSPNGISATRTPRSRGVDREWTRRGDERRARRRELPDHRYVAGALKDVSDSEASGEALRHVLIGGTHSVAAFSEEVAAAEGGEPLPAHKMTKIIGEVLAELDKNHERLVALARLACAPNGADIRM